MEISPVKTRVLQPPRDNLFEVIEQTDFILREKDVIVVSSKVVSINEGRCISTNGIEKEELVKREADVYYKAPDSRWGTCLKNGTFLAEAGIDESSANGFFILLPKDPHKSAKELHSFFIKKFSLANLGVIVVDSHSMPLRYGTTGVALGWWGIEPVTYLTDKPDLFGRPAKFTRINVVDSLAASGVFNMGELSKQTPLCIIKNIPHIKFSAQNTRNDLFIPPQEDLYWPIIKNFYTDR